MGSDDKGTNSDEGLVLMTEVLFRWMLGSDDRGTNSEEGRVVMTEVLIQMDVR